MHVVLVLFNGALADSADACTLFADDAKARASLLEHAIAPLAAALRGYESLAMWEVIGRRGTATCNHHVEPTRDHHVTTM